jgi:hypothetical protein
VVAVGADGAATAGAAAASGQTVRLAIGEQT